MKSYFPELSNDKLVERLTYTADNIDHLNPDYENYLGGGRINAFRALTDTTIDTPKLYRLDIRDIASNSLPGNSLKAGNEYHFTFTVQNFSNYYYKERVTFYLSSDDPDVEIIKNSVSTNLIPDDFNSIAPTFNTDVFSIRIKDDATFHKAEFKITADSEIPIIMRDVKFSYEILPASGIFIYDSEENNSTCSGTFFRNYFTDEGPAVHYHSGPSFPSSLNNFEGLFLSYGNLEEPYFPSEVIIKYLEQGGMLYVESGNLFGNFIGNKNLFELAGLKNAILIEQPESPFDSLYGSQNTITEGITFKKTDWKKINSIEVYEPNIVSKTAFTDANYGIVGIQNEGLNEQKTFLFSYPLSNLYDVDSLSNRTNLISQIFIFFDLPQKFSANFESRELTSKPPFKAKFYDLTMPDSGKQIITRKWDFDNDGVIDSEELYPEWTYNLPGDYTVTLEVSDGVNTETVTKDDYISVLNDNTALEFYGKSEYGSASLVTVKADSTLTIEADFTLEAWIKPYEGKLASGIDDLMDKYSFAINYDNDKKSITLATTHELWQYPPVKNSTPENSIIPGEWQHIAATYNAPLKEVKIFINGFEQSLEIEGEVLDSLDDNSWADITIGNNLYLGRSFNGAVDEVRVWNLARSGEDILRSMNNTLYGSEEGLILYLPLNEGSGDEVSDYSVFNHTTIIQNTSWVNGVTGIITSTESEFEINNLPDSYTLYQNYPNPFNPVTKIQYSVPQTSLVSLAVYDILGRKVIQLVNQEKLAGNYSIEFDASNFGSGIYIYRMQAGDYIKTHKAVLLK